MYSGKKNQKFHNSEKIFFVNFYEISQKTDFLKLLFNIAPVQENEEINCFWIFQF